MALINERWPRNLCPETCRFGQFRNDTLLENPQTLDTKIVRRGRRLWSADLTWTVENTERLAELRWYLDKLEGYAGSVQIWDFTSPYPQGLTLATSDTEATRVFWTYNTSRAPWNYGGLPSHWVLGSTVSVYTAAAAGATSIWLQGLQPSKLAAVKGQYVQIGRRLYLVENTVNSFSTGTVQLTLSSPLQAPAVVGDVVRLVEAGCEMRLAKQSFEASASAGSGFVSVSASFVETYRDFTA